MKVKTKAILIFGGIFLLLMFAYLWGYNTDNKLKASGVTTIGRIDKIEELPKWSYLHMSYYIGDKRYISYQNGLHTGISNKDIGKFYEVRYLPESPEIVRGNYSKEITDTIAILNAGFSREDIMNSNLGK